MTVDFIFLEKQTYEDQNELKSSPAKPDDSRKEVPETVYVNIWNADNGELKLADQKSVFADQLERIQQSSDISPQETPQDQATGTKLLWRPQYSEAVGGVGNSNQGEPPSAPTSFGKNFYQNLQDKPDQELFQFVSNPQASFCVPSVRLTEPGLWQILENKRAPVLDNQRKFGKFGSSTSRRPGLETPLSVASLMSEVAPRQPYVWGPREQVESSQTSFSGVETNQQHQVSNLEEEDNRQVYCRSQVEHCKLNPFPSGYIYEQQSGDFLVKFNENLNKKCSFLRLC